MRRLEWTSDLDVGVDTMNDEHQQLIALMNKFHTLTDEGASRDECVEALEALGTFTAKHFAHEESLMEEMDFPELAKHRNIHRQLLKQFGEHLARYSSNGQATELLMFLKLWLTAHIKGIDTKYGKHRAA